jgi:iron complex outermembrane receptor protein
VKFSDTAMMYASAARGYKGSLLDVTSPGQGVIVLKPEISTAYELGAKLTLLDRRLNVDANVFSTSIKDFQTQSNVFVGTALISIPNSVDLKSKGFEIDVIGNPSDNLTFNAGYLFNNVEFPKGYNGDDGTNLSGKQFISSPKHKLSLSGELSNEMGSNKEGFVTLNAVYKSGLLLSARSDPRYVFPSHTTVGASIGMRSMDDRWTVALYGRNLTDENEPIAYLASTWAGAVDGGIRAWTEGSISLRQVGLSFDAKF